MISPQTIISTIKASLAHNQFAAGGILLGAIGGIVAALRKAPKAIWDKTLSLVTVEVEVHNTDRAFDWLQTWLDAQPYSKRVRRMSATAKHVNQVDTLMLLPAPGIHLFRYRHRIIWMNRARKETNIKTASYVTKPGESIHLRMLGRSQLIIRELLEEARSMTERVEKRPELHISGGGYWHTAGEIPQRPLGSVIFPDGEGERLLADIKEFLASRDWYRERGIPYRRGYAFEGPPGTGKSSSITAIANHFRQPLYVCNIGSKSMSDEGLLELLASVPQGGMVLFEDIDAAAVSRDKPKKRKGKKSKAEADEESMDEDDSKSGITLSGLLQAIDGVAAAEGRMMFMTTNFPERLDNALVRPGRVDCRIRFGPASHNQCYRMFMRFFPDDGMLAASFADRVGDRGVSPAAIQQHFLLHRYDAAAAEATASSLVPQENAK